MKENKHQTSWTHTNLFTIYPLAHQKPVNKPEDYRRLVICSVTFSGQKCWLWALVRILHFPGILKGNICYQLNLAKSPPNKGPPPKLTDYLGAVVLGCKICNRQIGSNLPRDQGKHKKICWNHHLATKLENFDELLPPKRNLGIIFSGFSGEACETSTIGTLPKT